MACLRKNPAERPQSAWDVAKHIDPSIGDPLVTIRVERAPVEGDLSQVPVVKKGFSWEFYVVMAVLLVLLVVTFVILYYVAKFKP
jgi:hypothetical protein